LAGTVGDIDTSVVGTARVSRDASDAWRSTIARRFNAERARHRGTAYRQRAQRS
jgi:hypothetical protein